MSKPFVPLTPMLKTSLSTGSTENFSTAIADKDDKKTFLLADTSVKVVLGILFLTFSNVNIKFAEKELI